jgi:transcriptional regulator with GAF, ATPase, and Fis domain
VLEQVRLVAPKSTTVLITGETGTGKERISRAVHHLSHRRKSSMISANAVASRPPYWRTSSSAT